MIEPLLFVICVWIFVICVWIAVELRGLRELGCGEDDGPNVLPDGWSITRVGANFLELRYADVYWCFIGDNEVQDKMGSFVYKFLDALIKEV